MILLTRTLVILIFAVPWTGYAADPDFSRLFRFSDPSTQTEWAIRYEHGEGVNQDYAKAVRLYCAAAQRGYMLAQYQLGWLYANGRGTERDDALAAAWFQLAANQGSDHAQRMLKLLGVSGRQRARCVVPSATAPTLSLLSMASSEKRQIEEWVYDLAPEYGLDPRLVLLIIEVESAFNHLAKSPKDAQGLMQLIPETAERFGVRDVFDPLQNLHGGMAYLRWLLAFFKGDVRLALAGYNAGERAVERYQGIPPYPETRAYVAKIMRRYGRDFHPSVEAVVKPSTMLVAIDAARGEPVNNRTAQMQ